MRSYEQYILSNLNNVPKVEWKKDQKPTFLKKRTTLTLMMNLKKRKMSIMTTTLFLNEISDP